MRWFLLLLLLILPSMAGAVDLDEAAELEPEALAERLGIVGTSEAVVLVVADADIDRLMLGLREVALAPVADGEKFLRLVRGQVDGILQVRVERGDILWEGDLRTLAGHVTVFDAGDALTSPEARGLARDRALRGFDLYAFFDELDALPGTPERRAHCDATRDALPPGPDRGLVVQACANVDSMSGPAPVPVVVQEDDSEDLPDEDDVAAVAPVITPPPSSQRDPVLFRKDGLSRKAPRGTFPRLAVAGGGALLTGLFTARAFELEIAAEETYVAYRDAERVGDDIAVSTALFDTREFDQHRDAAIVGGSLALTTTITMLIWQAAESKLFQDRRGPSVAMLPVPLEGGLALSFSVELGR